MICDKCGKEFIGKKAGAHKRWCGHGPTTKDRILKKKNCLNCNKEFECLGYVKMTKINIKRERDFCSGKCQVAHTMTDEIKSKISKSRKNYLLNNPEKHPWINNKKFISKPCEILKKKLKLSNITFSEEYQPLSTNSYSIDIAFPDIKLGIEVNGNQHYKQDKKTLLNYYQERHNKIVKSGWRLIELHYLQCYSDNIVDEIKIHMDA